RSSSTASPLRRRERRRRPREEGDFPLEVFDLLPEVIGRAVARAVGEMTIVFPPVESDLLGFVDGADDQSDPDRQELDFRQRHFDVTGDGQSLVENSVQDIDEATDTVTVGRDRKVFHRRRRTQVWHGYSFRKAGKVV